MSLAPHLLAGARSGWKFGHQQALDSMQHDGLWCARENQGMGSLADYTAAKCGVSREDQDAFAAESHRRAVAAGEAGKFAAEIAPVTVKAGKSEVLVERDEGPRAELHAGRPGETAAGLCRGRHGDRRQRLADQRRGRGGRRRQRVGRAAAEIDLSGPDRRVGRTTPVSRRTCSSRRSARSRRCWPRPA